MKGILFAMRTGEKRKNINTKPCRLRAMPHVGDAVTSLCEQVPIGRATTSNRTACQPTLGKKLSLQLRKNRTACLIKSHADDGAAFSLTISQAFSKWINMFCQVIALWVEKNGE